MIQGCNVGTPSAQSRLQHNLDNFAILAGLIYYENTVINQHSYMV